MPYAQQETVAERLGQDVRKMQRDRVEKPATALILDRWQQVRTDIALHARGVWGEHAASDGVAYAEGAKVRIAQFMDRQLAAFRHEAVGVLHTAKRQAHDHQYLAAHWILDQVTPPNVKIRPRREIHQRWAAGHLGEAWADAPIENAPSGEAAPANRIEGWLKAWEYAALAGLTMAGVLGDDDSDAAARIESATADGRDIADVLGRLVQSEVQTSINAGDQLAADELDEYIEDRVWQTMEDEHVCDVCEENAGRSVDDVGDEPPAHPWCRCWLRIIPRDWQSLLDRPIARLGPGSMAFRDPSTGDVVGYVTVDFDKWERSVRD
jgi:hypothetical protein